MNSMVQPMPTGALASKLQKNWYEKSSARDTLMQKYAKDELDDSLTCLNWLHNINILNLSTTSVAQSQSQTSAYSEGSKVNPNQVMGTSFKKSDSDLSMPDFDFSKVTSYHPQGYEKIDYKTNPYIKPPYSYATLICKAMKESKKSKITLSAIYNWITENFLYYRMADPSWQNSIRHNLSLNKCFQKVPRKKDEPGKGGFWQMNPDYMDALETGAVVKKRKSTKEGGSPAPKKKSRSTCSSNEDSSSPMLGRRSGKSKSSDHDKASKNNLTTQLSPAQITTDDFSDLLGSDYNNPFPSSADDNLDLTVQGIKIEPPDWWCDSLDASSIRALVNASGPTIEPDFSFTSPANSHPWKTEKCDIDEAIAALDDMEKIFGPNF